MNYLITENYLSKSSHKLNLKHFLLLILPIVFIPAAYLFVAAVFIVQLLISNKSYIKINDFNFILVYAYILVGVFSSEYKLISLIYGLIIMLCFYSFQIMNYSLKSFQIIKIKRLIYSVSILVFLIGLLQYFNPNFSIPSKWVDSSEFNISKRIYSTFFNPNIFGFYINFIILLCIEDLDIKKKNIQWLVFIGGISCLILTFSRTSWISLIIALVVASLYNKKYIVYALVISIIIFSSDKLLGIGRIDPMKAVEDSSFLYRLDVWKACIEIIKENFISGIGFGTLFKHIGNYSTVVSPNIEHSHNLYIQIFTETGILGFGIFITILFKIIKKIKINLYTINNKTWITAFSVLLMSLVHGLVDSVPLTPQILMILCIYTGTLSSIKT